MTGENFRFSRTDLWDAQTKQHTKQSSRLAGMNRIPKHFGTVRVHSVKSREFFHFEPVKFGHVQYQTTPDELFQQRRVVGNIHRVLGRPEDHPLPHPRRTIRIRTAPARRCIGGGGFTDQSRTALGANPGRRNLRGRPGAPREKFVEPFEHGPSICGNGVTARTE